MIQFEFSPFTLFTHLLSKSIQPTQSHSHLLLLLIYSPHLYNQPKAILIYSFYSIYSFTLHIYTTTPKPFTFTPFTLFTHLLSISLSHNQSHSSSSFTTFTLFTHLPSTIPHTLMTSHIICPVVQHYSDTLAPPHI